MKVKYKLTLKLEIDKEENWDDSCPIYQVLKQAQSSIDHWTFLLRRTGAADMVLKPEVKLEYFQLSPERDT